MGGLTDIPEEEYEEKINMIEAELKEEEQEWSKLGMQHPSQGYNPDLFLLANGFDALKNLLIEKGLIGDRELSLVLNELMVNNMKLIREAVQPQIEEARRQALIVRDMPDGLNGQQRFPFEKP